MHSLTCVRSTMVHYKHMATEGGSGTDLMTFLLGIIIIGVLVQAGYSALSNLVGVQTPEPTTQEQVASTTSENSN